MHLQIAERLLAHPQLEPPVRQLLLANWSAFYLGSVAADVQTVNGAPRSSTHFYRTPPATDILAYDQMLLSFPELAAAACSTTAQAIFIANASVAGRYPGDCCYGSGSDAIAKWAIGIPSQKTGP